jgi:predicted RNA-binding protein YlqC (UPF0109 family)
MIQAANEPGKDTPKGSDVKELITAIVRTLVDKPEEVSVEAASQADATVLRLRVAPTDIGKVIGKQGRTARSLRTILSAASMKLQHRFSLDIIEDKDPNASNATTAP